MDKYVKNFRINPESVVITMFALKRLSRYWAGVEQLLTQLASFFLVTENFYFVDWVDAKTPVSQDGLSSSLFSVDEIKPIVDEI